MKFIQGLMALIACPLMFFIALPSHGYVQLTYTSDLIAWDYAYLYGEPNEELGAYVLPSFTLSFMSENDWSSTAPTTFFMNDPVVSIDPEFMVRPKLDASSHGRVTVNPDGSLVSWSLGLKFSELMTPPVSPATRMANTHVNIFSKGGSNSCNCDVVDVKTNLTTTLTQERLYKLGLAEIGYRDNNLASNWTIERKFNVPEPQSYLLTLPGLMLMALLQISRRRKII